MISRFRLRDLLLTLFLFTSLTSAWPWPPTLANLGIDGVIVRRQDNSNDDSTSSTRATTATKSASPASTAKSAKQTAKASDTAKASETAKASGTAKGTKAAKASDSAAASTDKAAASTISVNPALAAGGANMITPSSAGQATYYKISDHVTFKWNYTSLLITPSKVDAVVTCSKNDATYTLLSNATFEKTGSVVWDTLPDVTGTAPLLTETYGFVVYDAESAPSEVAGAGKLGASSPFLFGMYLPKEYTPLSSYKCSVCNAAFSDTERQAMKFMFGMCMVTVLSFTWFVSGLW